MEFEINGTIYTIEVVDDANINHEAKTDWCLGLTNWETQKVLIKRNQKNITKTLKHELTHVWLYEYGHNQADKHFSTEDVCEIVSSSNDFINDIVMQFECYMNKNKSQSAKKHKGK